MFDTLQGGKKGKPRRQPFVKRVPAFKRKQQEDAGWVHSRFLLYLAPLSLRSLYCLIGSIRARDSLKQNSLHKLAG